VLASGMKQGKDNLIGEVLFRTKDGDRASVHVYRGRSTFTLTRIMPGGRFDERRNIDAWARSVDDCIHEAVLEWDDLVLESAEWTPRS